MDGTAILLVVQRYGAEVVGGSEQHARLVARRLAQRHTVEVATTTALDYWTWTPHYRAGDVASLRAAMLTVSRPEVAAPLRHRARELKRELSPRAMAARYLEGLDGRRP